jgi:hypothetical protein
MSDRRFMRRLRKWLESPANRTLVCEMMLGIVPMATNPNEGPIQHQLARAFNLSRLYLLDGGAHIFAMAYGYAVHLTPNEIVTHAISIDVSGRNIRDVWELFHQAATTEEVIAI